MSRESEAKELNPECRRYAERLLAFMDPECVMSTGAQPETYTDLLVVGDVSRGEYFDVFKALNPLDAVTIREVDDAVLIGTQMHCKMGIAYHQKESFEARLFSLRSGDDVAPVHTTWSQGPWLPEAYAADLADAQIICDKSGMYAQLVSQFGSYPELLRQGIVDYTSKEIELKSRLLERDNADPLSRSLIENDIKLAQLRRIFASEGVYFRGMRYLATASEQLTDGSKHAIRALIG